MPTRSKGWISRPSASSAAKTARRSGSPRLGRRWRRSPRRLRAHAGVRAARRGRRPATFAAANHCFHQRSPGIEQRQPQKVGGLVHAADAFRELGAEHRREVGVEKQVRHDARPVAVARADADVDVLAGEIDDRGWSVSRRTASEGCASWNEPRCCASQFEAKVSSVRDAERALRRRRARRHRRRSKSAKASLTAGASRCPTSVSTTWRGRRRKSGAPIRSSSTLI